MEGELYLGFKRRITSSGLTAFSISQVRKSINGNLNSELDIPQNQEKVNAFEEVRDCKLNIKRDHLKEL